MSDLSRFDNKFGWDYISHRVLKFTVNLAETDVDDELLRFEDETSPTFDLPKLQVHITQSIKAFRMLGDTRSPIAELQTVATFQVRSLEDLNQKLTGDEAKTLHPFFTALLAGLSYSTNRGIILMKAAGSSLSKLPLPVKDPYRIIGLDKQPMLEQKPTEPKNE